MCVYLDKMIILSKKSHLINGKETTEILAVKREREIKRYEGF